MRRKKGRKGREKVKKRRHEGERDKQFYKTEEMKEKGEIKGRE